MPAPPVRLLTMMLVAGRFSTYFASRRAGDVHAAAGRDRRRSYSIGCVGKSFGLSLSELGLGALRRPAGTRDEQPGEGKSDC